MKYVAFQLDMKTALGGVHKLRLQDLAFFDHLSPSVYIFYGINVYKKSIFLTTYYPPLVNVVCERPQPYTIWTSSGIAFWSDISVMQLQPIFHHLLLFNKKILG